MAPYRPPGRSNRSGRSQDNDVFEGLPVKQWGQSSSRISLAPPVSEAQKGDEGKWGEPPMPRDYQMLHPYTQHILRLARSGKVASKRKAEADMDDDKPEDETAEEAKPSPDDRGYVAKKWKIVPEHLLEPEYKHFEFLAKRRKGMPSLYGPEQQSGAPVTLRKTKVAKADTNGDIAVYDVLVPEGQTIEGEMTEAVATELAEMKPVVAAPGTVIEGVGIANAEGVVVAEHLKSASAPRRNRPPPKKKGGPGRGKKRVTFTNPDGSTYTTVVPNATKIVPQPGQTVKHVAKGEEATADVTAEEAAANAATHADDDEEEGSGSDEGEEGSDDDDREDGELSQDEDTAMTNTNTPAPEPTSVATSGEDVSMTDPTEPLPPDTVKMESDGTPQPPADVSTATSVAEQVPGAEAPSSHEDSLAKTSPPVAESLAETVTADVEPATEAVETPHKTELPETTDLPSLTDLPEVIEPSEAAEIPETAEVVDPVGIAEPPPTPAIAEPAAEAVEEVVQPADENEPAEPAESTEPTPLVTQTEEPTAADGADDDLLGNLEKHIQGDN